MEQPLRSQRAAPVRKKHRQTQKEIEVRMLFLVEPLSGKFALFSWTVTVLLKTLEATWGHLYDAAITAVNTKSLSLIISPGQRHQVYSRVWVRKRENRKRL